jgi:proteasome assembly chaperone (PAC2) family protein
VDELRIRSRPELRRPIVIAAFAGWNDASEAATSAVRYMTRRWQTEPFADLDPDEFYDFTQPTARPQVRFEDGERVIRWPANDFTARTLEGQDRDLLLLSGTEPHVGWQRYTSAIIELCRDRDVSGFVTLGALLAEVSHARPIRVTGSSTDEYLQQRLDLGPATRSGYQGPTGIVGVLGQALRDAGIPTASVWANIPFYVQRTPNPKGALALLERLNGGFDLGLTLHDLEVFSARFDAQVSSDVSEDPQVEELARRIGENIEADEPDEPPTVREPEAESDLPDPQAMVDELEQFLREQRGREGPERS